MTIIKSNKEELTFKCTIVKLVYDKSDFKIYAVDVDVEKYEFIQKNSYGNVSIMGELPKMVIDSEYEVVAIEEKSKYGISYRVVSIRRDIPITEEDMLSFLKEVLTKKQAKTLYDVYPDIVQRVKENKLDDVDLKKLKGIGEITFEKIKNNIIENFYLADLANTFKGVLSLNMLKRIWKRYSSIELLMEKLQTEPYTTLTSVSGIGFKTADNMIIELQEENIIDFGYDVKTSEDRCLSCVLHLLKENEKDGHTKANLIEIRNACFKLVPACSNHFTEVIKNDKIYYDKLTMSIALTKTYNAEAYIAKTMLYNLKNAKNIWHYDVEMYRDVGEFKLSDEQIKILDNICKYNICILNGFAGSGKSASTQALINMLEDNGKTYKLLAPTGKASKVIAEFTKRQAYTIHRCLLSMEKKQYYLYEDVIIVDEFSMCDVDLFKELIEVIDFDKTKLLIIGDNAQLPSVGCGNLLHDFVATKLIPTVSLTKIFRYQDGGLMRCATDIRCGKTFLDSSMKGKATTFGNNKDYMFVDLNTEDIPMKAVVLYKKLLEAGNDRKDIQVLTAKNIGDCGTIMLNNMLQKVANPNYGKSKSMKIGDVEFYKGDLVLQKENYYCNGTLIVANGDVGVVTSISDDNVYVSFDDKIVEYDRKDMKAVSLGYAISIHKSQGSGIKNVIICSPKNHVFMMNSNLLYVALTRTKNKCYHLGSFNSINQAARKKANLTRHTFMQQLMLEINGNYF